MSPLTDAVAGPWQIIEASDSLSPEPAMRDDRWLAKLCAPRVALPIMCLVLLAILPWAVYRAEADNGCDLADFLRGGDYLLEHGCRHPCTALNRYLPSVDVACAALALLPRSWTSIIYYFANVACWFALLMVVHSGLLPPVRSAMNVRGLMAAGLLTLVIAIDGFLVGAFHLLMLLLMVAGLVHAVRGQLWRGGTLLGLAIWLKLLPIVGVAYLLLRRRWGAAGLALLVALALDAGLSVGAFGWRQAWVEHVTWVEGGLLSTVAGQMHGDVAGDADRITNQSTSVLLRRFLTVRGGHPELAITDLSSSALSLATGVLLLILAMLPVAAFWRQRGMDSYEYGAEIALVVLSTVWLSPVVWSYHLTAALPALAVVMAHQGTETRKQAMSIVWLAAMSLFAWPLARAAGHMWWAALYSGWQVIAIQRQSPSSAPVIEPRRATWRRLQTHRTQLPKGGLATSGNSGL